MSEIKTSVNRNGEEVCQTGARIPKTLYDEIMEAGKSIGIVANFTASLMYVVRAGLDSLNSGKKGD